MAFYRRALSLALGCCIIFSLAACAEGGGTQGGTVGDGGKPSVPSVPAPPAAEDPPKGYVYGAEQEDEYDAQYTRELLMLGDFGFTFSQLSGTDDYLRARTPTSGNREGKYVGIFYFLWQNEENKPYDISKLLEKYGETDTEHSPLWVMKGNEYYDADISPMNAFHYFEEPLYGYYASTDEWVVMRHLELLTYAGIDFLYLDFTNASANSPTARPSNIYPEATYVLLESILALQKKGVNCPRIVPVVCNPFTKDNKTRANVVEWVYRNYYAKDNFKYRSCWFTADSKLNPSGKPLLVTYTVERQDFSNKSAYDSFWLRQVVWPTMVSSASYANGFPWMDYELPQANYGGFMNVSVAQHTGGSWSSQAFLARSKRLDTYLYRGRGAIGAKKYAVETAGLEDANEGLNFGEQWLNVLEATGEREPSVVTVTGWNEWVAQKLQIENMAYATFVDTFSVAFSRDAEMMRDKGGYSDNFYMQLAENVAKFKRKPSARKSDAAMWKKQTIDIHDFSAWENVSAKYIDFSGDAMRRDKDSVGHVYHYTDDSARNDISYLKIANDSENLYVLVCTKDAITPYEAGDDCWMNLYLSLGEGGYKGYHYVINRAPFDGKTTIERLTEGEAGISAETLSARAEYAVEGNKIAFRIPLEALGVTSKDVIGVKACDNLFAVKRTEGDENTPGNDGVGVYRFGDVEAFYCGGDCAPIGRLNYAYRMAY